MASWKKTITTPFKKVSTLFNQQPPRDNNAKKAQAEQEKRVMDLQGEVMACGYEDVQVMWSMLDKSKSTHCNISS
ncbi:hypothetical protein TanjilG_29180 [Lupinus angustifolius]|uniref:Uncharacterized protein n=1 Tax=Lupinus angustifolius TaxID=3871 RepID=A0A1J7GII8_LUPAN|nr:PREDICTED: uncharacterized protein LOC109362200 [Lupinus angustifolius]XP_019463383.1 PREDICTED: uncharacterized protein LOC109362200 [Lupinus angustifolius]OIW00190.1 hypothetical protein TanjilG_29180 [Lupinus angustifolius]